jgi:hypothetical protein
MSGQIEPTTSPLWQRDRLPLALLGLLVVAGALLRLAMTRAQSPAFIGVSDSTYYILAAHFDLFHYAAEADGNPWPAGYPAFLALMHLLSDQLSFTILVQHLLGIGTALLLFFAVRRVASAWWGLVPAAVLLLAGPELFLEQAPMTEPLFEFLIAGSLYCTARALDQQGLQWCFNAGALAALAATVRVIGVPVAAVLILWLFAAVGGGLKARLTGALVALLAVTLVLGTYLIEMKREKGFGGPALTRTGEWRPPVRANQPASFARRMGRELSRFWSSDHNASRGTSGVATVGYSYGGVVWLMGTPSPGQHRTAASWYPTAPLSVDDGLLATMKAYERHSRLEGPALVVLLALALVGLPFARGPQLWLGVLVLATAAVVLIAPVAYVYFDARYAVPGYGPLAAAGAIGGAALWQRLSLRRRARPLVRVRTPEPVP